MEYYLSIRKKTTSICVKILFFALFYNCTSLPAQKDDLQKLQLIVDNSDHIVFIPKNAYNIYGRLYLKNNQNIIGNGATIFQKKANTPIFDCKDKSNIKISDINFVGYRNDYKPTSSSVAVGIYCWGANNISIKGNNFTGFSYSPIAGLRNTFGITVENNTFLGTGLFDDRFYQKDHTGITLGGENIIIRNNEISNSSQGIIIAEGSENIEITNNHIFDLPLEHGIYVDYGCSEVLIKNNRIENVIGSGIKVQNRNFAMARSENITIADNTIIGTKIGDGILVNNSEGNLLYANNVLIENNTVKDIGQHGINVRFTKKATVKNNTILDVLHCGIYLKENYDLLLENNILKNMGENGIFDEGSGERIVISKNIITNPGSNGTDKNGLSSGIFIGTGGNREILINKVKGQKDKMQYALYIAEGDQKSISIEGNDFSGARDYGIRLNSNKTKLKKFENNTVNATIGKSEVMNKPLK